VSAIVSELNEIRKKENTDESDFRLILMVEINQAYNKRKDLTPFEQDIIRYVVDVFKIFMDGGVI
jgi:hypothetical protein